MKDLLEQFMHMGLKPNEAEILLACYKKPDGVYVHELAKQTEIKRTTIDLIVDRLVDNHFLSRHKVGARYAYRPLDPKLLLERQKEKLLQLEKALPALQALSHFSQKSDFYFFEGDDGIRSLYHDLFQTMRMEMQKENPRPHYSISSGRDLEKLMPDASSFLEENRLKIGFAIDIIAPQSAKNVPAWQIDSAKKRRVHYFDDNKYPFSISIDIFGDKVAMHGTENTISGFVIESAELAASMRSLFKLAWNFLDTP